MNHTLRTHITSMKFSFKKYITTKIILRDINAAYIFAL